MVNKDTISKTVDAIVNEYLSEHSDLRCLFNDELDAKDEFLFFINNFSDINIVIEQLFRENKKTRNESTSLFSEYMKSLDNNMTDLNKKKLKVSEKRMLIATLIYFLVNKDFSIKDLPIDYADSQNYSGAHWYRGQSNYQWGLIPSMFRNLNNVFTDPTTITQKTIEDIYSKGGLLSKWSDVFKNGTVDYNFLAYMQHSIAYSPLLDFTSDFPTALSFALGNRSALNEFKYKDSAVYQVEVNKDRLKQNKKDQIPADFYIQYMPDKYIIGTPLFGKTPKSFNDIIEALTPKFVMIDIVTNDRMKYQHGKFIFFYNYLSIQGMICTWLNKDLTVTKFRIRKEEKDRWCDRLRQDCPYLMIEKMMNPYSYFSDQ